MNQRIALSLALVVCLVSPASAGAQTIIYVDASAPLPDPPCPPGGDGMSWCTAFTDLQDALQAPPANSEIWVANGTYIPGGVQSDFFQLKALVEIYGGFEGADSINFPGGETQRSQRNPETNGTVLSGDIGQDDNPDGTIVPTNTSIIVKGAVGALNETARLDGFTIKGATSAAIENINSSPILENLLITGNTGTGFNGLGIRNMGNSAPTITNCVFTNNDASTNSGGAMSNENTSRPLVTDCTFTSNLAIIGGAVHNTGQSIVRIARCTFVSNSTTVTGAGFGGAIGMEGTSSTELRDCLFLGNEAPFGSGGAVWAGGSDALFVNCLFSDNRAHVNDQFFGGGAMYVTGGDTNLVNCAFIWNRAEDAWGGGVSAVKANSLELMNCLFASNRAQDGGGLAVHDMQGVTTVNSTYNGNRADGRAGGILLDNQNQPFDAIHVFNSILWANFVPGSTDPVADQLMVINGGSADVQYSCIDDGSPGGSIPFGGPPNIDTNPTFESDTFGNWSDPATFNTGTNETILFDTSASFDPSGLVGKFIRPSFSSFFHYRIVANTATTITVFGDAASLGTTGAGYTILDFRLAVASPCIDAGNDPDVLADDGDLDLDADILEPTPLDLDLLPRFVDSALDPSDLIGCGAVRVDMGVYEYRFGCAGCKLGDMNFDGLVDGRDIQPFVDCLLIDDTQCECHCGDFVGRNGIDISDIPCFIESLLLGDTEASCVDLTCNPPGAPATDCNNNGLDDAVDIVVGSSEDSNLNGIPDECEIDENSQAPGGPFYCTTDCDPDCNDNGIPDECETDCNTNGIPDDCDLAAQTSNDINGNAIPDECEDDCNGNGIPDEWDVDPTDPDGNGQVSPDCNGNGEPDECETDCNANGVPDDCDIDPADPDGNGQVSVDCNGNHWPDECDLTVPQPFGSLDCNDNGIPDECDIADCTGDSSCADCNANGIPDGCDITAGISLDGNTNGIPDECEQQQSQGGGGSSPTPEGDGAPIASEEAYAEFYGWCLSQTWGPSLHCPCSAQFQAMVDKQQELGLPPGLPMFE